MKTVLEYLAEQKDMACHNLLCYSKTYGMDTPKEGMEQAFAEAEREVEIVEELMEMAQGDLFRQRAEMSRYFAFRRMLCEHNRAKLKSKSVKKIPQQTCSNYSFNCRVDRNGITVSINNMKLTYFSDDLLMHQGSKVNVQLNPENMCDATVSTTVEDNTFRVKLRKVV